MKAVAFPQQILLCGFCCLFMMACNPLGEQKGISSDIGGDPAPVYSNLVLGQSDFRDFYTNAATPSASSIYYSGQISKVGSYYYIPDFYNNRVIVKKDSLQSDALFALGQDSLTVGYTYGGADAPSALNFNAPTASATNGTNLIITDSGNNRILIWNTAPTNSTTPADVVLGQSNFTSGDPDAGGTVSAKSLHFPYGAVVIGTKLVATDFSNNRVLVWNTIPTSNYTAADVVIGQADFVSESGNRGGSVAANTLYYPFGVATDGTKLFIGDYFNHRGLIFNTVPTALDANADVVFCQSNFTTRASATTQAGCKNTAHGAFVGSTFYLADYVNNRVLYYSSVVASGAAGNPDGVFGQADYVSGSANRGASTPTASSLYLPWNVQVIDGDLIVHDLTNYRILGFDTMPTGVGTDSADWQLGQDGFTTKNLNKGSVNKNGYDSVGCMDVNEDYVIVGDRFNSRVLVYDKDSPEDGPIVVIGKENYTDTCKQNGIACPAAAADNLNQAEGCALDDENRIYISDRYRNRVLVYNSVPTSDGADADFVLGQSDFVSSTANTGASGYQKLNQPMGLDVHNNKLYVAENANNRVSVYNLPITGNHPSASHIVGQPDEDTTGHGLTDSKLRSPMGVTVMDNKLFTFEYTNRRVMVFDPIPTANGPAASYVLGQPDFTTNNAGAATQNTFGYSNQSFSMIFHDGYYYIPDRGGYRILGFDSENMANGMNATYVVGQKDFETVAFRPQGNSDNNLFGVLYGVNGIVDDPEDPYVWISDSYANRVMRIKRTDFLSKRNQ